AARRYKSHSIGVRPSVKGLQRKTLLALAWSSTSAPHGQSFLKFGQVLLVVRVGPQHSLRRCEFIKFLFRQRSGQYELANPVKKRQHIDRQCEDRAEHSPNDREMERANDERNNQYRKTN